MRIRAFTWGKLVRISPSQVRQARENAWGMLVGNDISSRILHSCVMWWRVCRQEGVERRQVRQWPDSGLETPRFTRLRDAGVVSWRVEPWGERPGSALGLGRVGVRSGYGRRRQAAEASQGDEQTTASWLVFEELHIGLSCRRRPSEEPILDPMPAGAAAVDSAQLGGF